MKVPKPMWATIRGVLIEHVYTSDAGMDCYSIYELLGPKSEVLYGYAPNWTLQAFRLDLDAPIFEEMLFFTSLEEARYAAGNTSNEEQGIEPFRYDKSQYTDEPVMHYCLCCGYKTIEGYLTDFGYSRPPSTWDICPICSWEDDAVGFEHPDEACGPNHVSLKQAQRNFVEFGAVERRFTQHVREPREDDERDPNWRLIE